MLVLTRKPQEKIRIGDDIVITVLRMKGKSVRLGIEAPGNVQVLRGELVFDVPDEPDESSEESSATLALRPARASGADAPTWPADTHPGIASDHDQERCDVDVGHSRVPRESRADILSKLVQCDRPLRAMLDRRAVVS